jgi:hypothetical protein
MIETLGLVSTVVQGYKWLNVWHEQQANPPHLPENAVLVFKRFKEAYDSRSIEKLSSLLSDSYKGDVHGAVDKQEFLDKQKCNFESLPWGIYPCITLNVYSVIENTQDIFSAIVDTHSIATVFGIPTFIDYASAPIRCQIESEGGLWIITEMFVEERLVQKPL